MNPVDLTDSPVGPGFLRALTGRTCARLYVAPEPLQIIQAD